MKILVIDNYDSFVWNLVHAVKKISTGEVTVKRNNEIMMETVKQYDKILLSPGPGIPEEAGSLLAVINAYASSLPILGVCLGHQALAVAFGGSLINLANVYHGVATEAKLTSSPGTLFKDVPDVFPVGRYHSWIVDETTLPASFTVTARDENGYIMAMQHKTNPVYGVQFHPESILTPCGETILNNWLKQ